MVNKRQDWLDTVAKVEALQVAKDRRCFSATHEEILSGATTDIYFVKTLEILRHLHKEDSVVVAELFPRRDGILAGTEELLRFLADKDVEVWVMEEGSPIHDKEVVVRIKGKYSEFGLFETTMLGILASSSGWATAAKIMKEACGEKQMCCFGSRHLHPAVAPVMERAAMIGGADSCSCILGAKLLGLEPAGTCPHALFLIVGNTVEGAKAYDAVMPPEATRLMLVDTFKDEIEESLLLGEALGEKLQGVRLDTPSERGGVTVGLIKELRARLDMAGYPQVKIFVSGGLTPEKARLLAAAGADSFGVGSYISVSYTHLIAGSRLFSN